MHIVIYLLRFSPISGILLPLLCDVLKLVVASSNCSFPIYMYKTHVITIILQIMILLLQLSFSPISGIMLSLLFDVLQLVVASSDCCSSSCEYDHIESINLPHECQINFTCL